MATKEKKKEPVLESVIFLEFPIERDGKKIDRVTMRRPKVADMRVAQASSTTNAEYECTLFTNLCGMTPEEMNQVDQKDYMSMQEAYTAFLA